MVLTDKQLMMPPQKKSNKNTPTDANQEDHHIAEDNGNTLATEPSQISDQEKEQNLRPFRRHELRKPRIPWKHLLRKKLKKKMRRL
jgi:hypothetical protein